MKAAVYYTETGLQIDERPVVHPGPDELVVRVAAAGICGSDLHYYRDGHIGDWWIRQPHVLGHEFAGTVVSIGAEVEGFHSGERVVVEPILPCERCDICARGLYNLCPHLRFTGSPHTDGAFQEYVTVRPHFAHRIPDDMPFQLAALVEPTSIAVHALRRSRLTLGDSVAVIGAGPIGLLTLAVARASGAASVVVSDLDETRLEMAQQLGASAVFHARDDVAARVQDHTGGHGADIVFEAVGHPDTVNAGLRMVRPGGRLVVIGVSPEAAITFDMMLAQSREVEVIPVYLGRDAFPTAIELLASGRVPAQQIVTHTFPLLDALDALETAAGRRDPAVKVLLEMDDSG